MAEAAVGELTQRGVAALVLPRLDFTAAPFADAFPGTVSVRPATVTALVRDIGEALAGGGWRGLAIANAHLDPAHLEALHAAADELRRAAHGFAVAFPDLTRRSWAARLTEEFRSGACHAGRYEGSIVLARRPELVRRDVARRLPPNPASLVDAIRRGDRSFEDAGGPEAYFGSPADATADEGEVTVRALGAILADSVLDTLAAENQAAEGG